MDTLGLLNRRIVLNIGHLLLPVKTQTDTQARLSMLKMWIIVGVLSAGPMPLVAQTVSVSGPGVNYGQSATFSASISQSGISGGTMNFLDGGVSFCSGSISSSHASCTTNRLLAGSHTITAEWVNANKYSTNSDNLTVYKITPTLSVATSGTPSTYGGSVTSTATISGGVTGPPGPSGSITFDNNGQGMGTGSISGTSAAYSTSSLTAGSHTITMVYPGDSNFNGVTSAGITQTVNKATPATGVFCNPSSLIYVPSGGSGNLTTCTATVNAPGSTANVVFTYNGNGWTTVPLSGGTASAAGFGHWTPAATYSINAAYAGDGNYNATSASTTFTVTKATPTTSVSCNPGSVVYVPSGGGTLTTYTATVNAPGSTANVVLHV